MSLYRQGDVIIIRKDDLTHTQDVLPTPVDGRTVLLEGEATGHHHSIDARLGTLYRLQPDDMPSPGSIGALVITEEGARLEHQEHDTIDLPPGTYEVRRQREFSSAEGFRFVQD